MRINQEAERPPRCIISATDLPVWGTSKIRLALIYAISRSENPELKCSFTPSHTHPVCRAEIKTFNDFLSDTYKCGMHDVKKISTFSVGSSSPTIWFVLHCASSTANTAFSLRYFNATTSHSVLVIKVILACVQLGDRVRIRLQFLFNNIVENNAWKYLLNI